MAQRTPHQCCCTPDQRDHLARQRLAVLNRQDWSDPAGAGVKPDSDFAWFADTVAARLRLRAFAGPTHDDR